MIKEDFLKALHGEKIKKELTKEGWELIRDRDTAFELKRESLLQIYIDIGVSKKAIKRFNL